ncbi:MAG: XRE family transcriptional regulator [Deltaproteobacteria bacterium]|nr:XRE family transcriptional regulator [Deltaproteobacteria bacterium]
MEKSKKKPESIALITPEILTWAMKRARMEPSSLAKKMKKMDISESSIRQWEEGSGNPTFSEAQDLAKSLYIPFGYLYLSKPPKENIPMPDLRTVRGEQLEFSAELRDVAINILGMQEWYREYLKEEGVKPLPFVGKFSLSTDTKVIAEDIRKTLDLREEARKQFTKDAFYSGLIQKAENAGILVMKSGRVGENYTRPLDLGEFRGFSYSDPLAPVVFINGKDYEAAQIFTLIHEVAHIWLGESGVSNLDIFQGIGNRKDIERKCNQVAAEVLVPEEIFLKKWNDEFDRDKNIKKLSIYFRVSHAVIALRGKELGKISQSEFSGVYQADKRKWDEKKKKQKERQKTKKGGPSSNKVLVIQNSRLFTRTVLQSVFSERTLIREGAQLLGAAPDRLGKLAQEVGLA